MDSDDCPPGAEGYEDTHTEKPKKREDEGASTKAEAEFKEHLKSLKIKVEDGSTRCMVERKGRDVAGKWIYLCYPCAAVCSGETILQTHITGKKHKTKLTLKSIWPVSIFEEHPYIKSEKGEDSEKKKNDGGCTEQTLQKMADVVSMHNLDVSSLESKYAQFRHQRAAIQDTLDKLEAPLLGVEYLVELEPDEPHHEPSYTCVLCNKQGAPRTIVNHMVSYWHRIRYLWRHFPTTHQMMQPYRNVSKYRDGVGIVMNRLVHRIQESYGRLMPIVVNKDRFNREKDQITQWLFKGYHFSEKTGQTFAEVVDTDLITSLGRNDKGQPSQPPKKDPSPPIVLPPIRPRRERRQSLDALSDDLGKLDDRDSRERYRRRSPHRDRVYGIRDTKVPHPQRFRPRSTSRERRERERRAIAERIKDGKHESSKSGKPSNLDYKLMMAEEHSAQAEQAAAKTLAYHEKNPEKHPLYPEEWKKFWNKRYKELQTEGKDPSKFDFKPEWIVFWTKRMKELHEEELKREIAEVHRRLNLPPPEDRSRRSPPPRSPTRRRSRSPIHINRSRSPRRRSPSRPGRSSRGRSRSPLYRNLSPAPRRYYRQPKDNPYVWRREDKKKSLSPLSVREAQMRGRSPPRAAGRQSPSPLPDTVMISDDEFKVDPHSPLGSASSLGSLPDARSPTMSHAGSVHSGRPRPVSRSVRAASPRRDDTPDDVVSSLRVLVALEDYLGSLGPKLIDLLALALKMEKEKPNSSEALLENELSVNLIETTKEKLKGAVQAGLISSSAVAAARKAITKAATMLHEADKRQKEKKKEANRSEALPVDGVGAVDKVAIAKQMAAALIAQGKTDVTQEELAQLVDAVVGIAEAKKREAAEKAGAAAATAKAAAAAAARNAAAKPLFAATAPKVATIEKPSASSSSGSALQLLQSAYDENEKKAEKEETDVMDGLSDSDLKTLLQNFSELSAEEQHGLIAYLKKLEAKDPQRVERLREYVSAAVSAAPTPPEPEKPPAAPEPAPAPSAAPATLTIESDDDDYTVEEVFESAAEKVKENQIQKEMEVVKKFINSEKPQDSKPEVEEVPLIPKTEVIKSSLANVSANASAANVLALIQASVHTSTQPSVVNSTSTSHPKLFGDKSEEHKTNSDLPTDVAILLAALSGATSAGMPNAGGTNKNLTIKSQNQTINVNSIQADSGIKQKNSFDDSIQESNLGGLRNLGAMGLNNPPYASNNRQYCRSGGPTGENPQNFGNRGFNQPLYNNGSSMREPMNSQRGYSDAGGMGNQPITVMNNDPSKSQRGFGDIGGLGNQPFTSKNNEPINSQEGYGNMVGMGKQPFTNMISEPMNSQEGYGVMGGMGKQNFTSANSKPMNSQGGYGDMGGLAKQTFTSTNNEPMNSKGGYGDMGGMVKQPLTNMNCDPLKKKDIYQNQGHPNSYSDGYCPQKSYPDNNQWEDTSKPYAGDMGRNRGNYCNDEYNMADKFGSSNVYGGGNMEVKYPQDQYGNPNTGFGDRGGFNRGGGANQRGGGGVRGRGGRGRGRGTFY